MILNYIKSLFKKNVVEIEEPKEFKVLPPCLFKIGDIVNIKTLEDPTKKFKVVDIINWKTDYSLIVEYFYDNKLFKFSQTPDEFEINFESDFEITTSEIPFDQFFKLVLTGELYHKWERNQ